MADELTLDSALSLMTVTPEDKPAAPAVETPPVADTPPMTAEAGADAPPADQTPPSDAEVTPAGDVDQGDALPLIEPPTSWTTEEKAEWQSLSRKAQETIQRREQANHTELRNLQNGSAEQRKTAAAEVARLQGLAGQIETVLSEKVADLASQFPEIKSEADVVALAERDPARYSIFQAKLAALNAVNQTKAAALVETNKVAQAQQTEHLAKAKDALLDAFPTWKAPDVAKREIVELQDYAITLGASEATARSTLDPVIYKLAHKAMLYDRAQAAKTTALTRDPPRTLKVGAQVVDPKAAGKEESRRSQLGKLSSSGDIDDARGLLRA